MRPGPARYSADPVRTETFIGSPGSLNIRVAFYCVIDRDVLRLGDGAIWRSTAHIIVWRVCW